MVKIIVLGGGFGGVRCALELNKKLKKEETEERIEIKINKNLQEGS